MVYGGVHTCVMGMKITPRPCVPLRRGVRRGGLTGLRESFSYRLVVLWAGGLEHSVFDDGLFAAVVATFAHGVAEVPSAAVGADGDCGSNCVVVGTTFSGAGFGLFSFRMCHFCLSFLLLFLY